MVKVSISQLIEPEAPQWFRRFVLRLESVFVTRYPTAPVRVCSFDATADLPPASEWPGCIAFVRSPAGFVGSNGTTWGAL